MKIAAIWFDVDGTLIRTKGAGRQAFVETAQIAFGIYDPMKDIHFAGRTDRSIVAEFFQKHQIPLTSDNFNRFFAIYPSVLQKVLPRYNGYVCPGVIEFLNFLESLGNFKPLIGLLTGNIYLGAEIKLRYFNLWHRFEAGIFGDQHEDRIMLAYQALEFMQQINPNITGSNLVIVGDTPADIKCGKAIGAKTVAVTTGGASWNELKQTGPDLIVSTLNETSLHNFFLNR